ncbi:MAG: TVP38/TMEM64 family protein [Verrucomicrobia bacterium]|nr:TVP38/TMEM64 family protein [Verrucomicrobiota bacterium]
MRKGFHLELGLNKPSGTEKIILKATIKTALGLVALVLFFVTAIQIDPSRIEDFLRGSGFLAPLLFSLLMIIGVVVSPIPTSPLTLMSAKLFGVWGGILMTLTSATIGAAAAFCISRKLGETFWKRSPSYRRFQKLLPKDVTAWAIFVLRLPPSPTFDVVSYAAGLTNIPLWQFMVATFLGMAPVVAALCLAGSVLPAAWLWTLTAAVLLFAGYRLWNVSRGREAPGNK